MLGEKGRKLQNGEIVANYLPGGEVSVSVQTVSARLVMNGEKTGKYYPDSKN